MQTEGYFICLILCKNRRNFRFIGYGVRPGGVRGNENERNERNERMKEMKEMKINERIENERFPKNGINENGNETFLWAKMKERRFHHLRFTILPISDKGAHFRAIQGWRAPKVIPKLPGAVCVLAEKCFIFHYFHFRWGAK